MMKAIDIRECNKLERNAKRIEKARILIELAISENEVGELDLVFVAAKLKKASEKMMQVRNSIVTNSP